LVHRSWVVAKSEEKQLFYNREEIEQVGCMLCLATADLSFFFPHY